MKAKQVSEVETWQDIPNVGPKMERDFVALGLKNPKDFKERDAFVLYKKICTVRGTRLDPCVFDIHMTAVDFMNGLSEKQWWQYNKEGKRTYDNL